jgi:plasmid maintenance system antidote protein VapI
MSTTLTKSKPNKPKQRKVHQISCTSKKLSTLQTGEYVSHTSNYITLLPPGEIIAEKMSEMGIDAAELARRMKVSVETLGKLLRFEIPITESLAKKIEEATKMSASLMLRHEKSYQINLKYSKEHTEIPVYFDGEIVNQPTRDGGEAATP